MGNQPHKDDTCQQNLNDLKQKLQLTNAILEMSHNWREYLDQLSGDDNKDIRIGLYSLICLLHEFIIMKMQIQKKISFSESYDLNKFSSKREYLEIKITKFLTTYGKRLDKSIEDQIVLIQGWIRDEYQFILNLNIIMDHNKHMSSAMYIQST